MAFQLPLSASQSFAPFFIELEAQRPALGIGGYGQLTCVIVR